MLGAGVSSTIKSGKTTTMEDELGGVGGLFPTNAALSAPTVPITASTNIDLRVDPTLGANTLPIADPMLLLTATAIVAVVRPFVSNHV